MSTISDIKLMETRETVLQCLTGMIIEGKAQKAREFLKEVRAFEKMTCTTTLNAITLRDLYEAILEAELTGGY